MFCSCGPNLVILAWTRDKLSRGQASAYRTHRHTDRQTQPTTIPEGQNWPRVKMLSTLLALCEENPPVTGGFPDKGPIMQSFDFFLYFSQNKLLNKHSNCHWFDMTWRSWDISVMLVASARFLSSFGPFCHIYWNSISTFPSLHHQTYHCLRFQ